MTNFLVLLKPDCVQRNIIGKIITRFEKKNFKIREIRFFSDKNVIKDTMELHYFEHSSSNYYEREKDMDKEKTCKKTKKSFVQSNHS